MLRSLWIAKTGLDAQQKNLDVISNNLANVNTTGFKRSRATFHDLLYQTLRQPGAPTSQQSQLPTGLQLGTGVEVSATTRQFSQGTIADTGNMMDLAISGQGFFMIQMPDGSSSYTRDGNFMLNSQGQMVNSSGYHVQPGIVIPLSAQKVIIGQDGTVSVILPGNPAPQQVGQIQITTFFNPVGLNALGDNLFEETSASGQPNPGTPGQSGFGFLRQGTLEGSNVNVAEELVNMIQAQRAYEINSRAIQTSDQMLQKLAQL